MTWGDMKRFVILPLGGHFSLYVGKKILGAKQKSNSYFSSGSSKMKEGKGKVREGKGRKEDGRENDHEI